MSSQLLALRVMPLGAMEKMKAKENPKRGGQRKWRMEGGKSHETINACQILAGNQTLDPALWVHSYLIFVIEEIYVR